jgi:tetratricopeptide (TPR) repeat protein
VAQRLESFQRIAQLSPDAQQQVRSADIAMSLGERLRSAGAYAEAAENFRQAWETYRQHLGAGEFNTAKAVIFLATTVGSSGNFAEAVQILRAAKEDFTGGPVEGTDLFPVLLEHEGDISMKQKAYERAEDCFRRGSQAWQMVAGANSPEYLQCRYKLVGALHLLERRADAERLCRETIDHAESSKSKRDVATKLAYLYSSLAKLCQEQGNHSSAVEAFSAILPASESTWRNQSSMLKQMYEAYAQSLERLERAEEAKAARAKAEVCGRDANLASEFPIPASSPEESGCATQQD